ncbi:hypothetical protein CVT25_005193 [Psilocybe cyanescens]|uniref:Uncharacterized protein n=1 Tax=Psilocybe cyanescens TaxID=93625 RepID=A0A409XE27_PSICY|nr:hypothetical protein CVT25_005193 [Psilocybe cyanescens]
MPNPGNFHGSRLEFLLGEKPAYELAAAAGQGAEAISNIQRQYFKRYPIELPLNVEPTAEFLANVDDDAADVDIQEPDVDKLIPEEYREAVERMEARRAIVNFRKDQIQRWFKYQKAKTAHKNNDTKSKEGLPNPYEILTQKLIGQEHT